MPDLSLRVPSLIYLSVICVLVGVLIAPLFTDVPAGTIPTTSRSDAGFEMETGDMHARHHGTLDVAAEGAPDVALLVEKDALDGWNVTLRTRNFTFAPEAVNGPHIPNTGHAHLYVNDVKIARVYGPHVHIPDLPPGRHVIRVSLSSNDHSYYRVDGARITAERAVTQEPS